MSVALYPHQIDLERRIYEQWSAGMRNVMPVSATGSGKTVVLSKLMRDESGVSTAIAHRQELVSQIALALARNGVRHGILGAKKGSPLVRVINAIQTAELGYSMFDPNARTNVGGVDTVVKMSPNDPAFLATTLLVQDEGHHVLKENKWGKVALMFRNARGLFPTATPLRADGKGLGRHADGLVDCLVEAPSMRDIINMGYLTDYRIIAPPNDIDFSNVGVSQATGDFNLEQLRAAVHKSHITGDIVAHYLKFANGKTGVTFAVDIEAATEIAAAYRAAGVAAEVVSGKTPDALRAQIFRRLRNREILQIVNVDIISEGTDIPAIEVVSFGRPTESFGLFVQQFGRALRLMLSPEAAAIHSSLTDEGRRAAIAASMKPKAIILDHVNNVLRHGLPDAPREWSLNRRDRKAAKKVGDIPLRTCVICFEPYERVYKCCPHCGYYPEPVARGGAEFVDGDLTEYSPEFLAALRGEIARIHDAPSFPRNAAPEVIGAIKKRHWERQQAHYRLTNSIAWWAGLEQAQGHSESESYRRFYFKFGIDVAGAQTLGRPEADELSGRVLAELAKNGIDGTIDAASYFSVKG